MQPNKTHQPPTKPQQTANIQIQNPKQNSQTSNQPPLKQALYHTTNKNQIKNNNQTKANFIPTPKSLKQPQQAAKSKTQTKFNHQNQQTTKPPQSIITKRKPTICVTQNQTQQTTIPQAINTNPNNSIHNNTNVLILQTYKT